MYNTCNYEFYFSLPFFEPGAAGRRLRGRLRERDRAHDHDRAHESGSWTP